MNILIVDDNEMSAKRIQRSLSSEEDWRFLILSDAAFAHELAAFGVSVDVALVDLRFVSGNPSGEEEFEGFSVCQRIRQALPKTVIVGYSTSFGVENEENSRLKAKFHEMGADRVVAFDHFTLTPVNEIRDEFEAAKREKRSEVEGKPRVFIGSSGEGLEVARCVQNELARDYEIEIWNQIAFGLSTVTIEALEDAVSRCAFGIFIFTPDDLLNSRGEEKVVARDNVIFEAGLFLGRLGRHRTFIVSDRSASIVLPSDLAGVTTATYDGKGGALMAAVGPACQQIRVAVTSAMGE